MLLVVWFVVVSCVCSCSVVLVVVCVWNLVGNVILNSMFFIMYVLYGCWKWNGLLLNSML